MARAKTVSRRKPRPRVARLAFSLAALVAVAGLAFLAPVVSDGYAALQWTRHYAAGLGSERPHERLKLAGRWAARAVDGLAPLPQAREAAALALQTGLGLESERPAAARALYVEVHAALARQRASSWRGFGLADLTEEARQRALARPAPSPSPTPVATPAPPTPSPTVTPSPSPTPSPTPKPKPAPRRGRPRASGARP